MPLMRQAAPARKAKTMKLAGLPMIEAAIERSISHTESVPIEWAGDRASLLAAVGQSWAGEMDSAAESDGTIDVWGWTELTPDDEMEWRLRVRLAD